MVDISVGMGEVRVRARLTNAVDEALARRDMLAPERVRTYDADALVDTGAVRVVLPPEVVSRLGLGTRGQRVAEYADGRREAVGVTEPLVIELEGRDTLEEALVLGDEVPGGQRRSRRMRMPGSGRSVTYGVGVTCWPGTSTSRKRWPIAARIRTASIIANALPMHWRGPPPNGK